ncbi:MAG: hypothetical protein E5Y55_16255 [Mesorhizobium sp.]|nr:MAG: hypothetical protein EOR00_20635 [Mesorhizobium sp.]RWQ05103.1 MAG: hypothetical protein EOR89_07465 [Mesorhizobium sp.]TIM44556.1 MAG: hypothetical protein E5Y55_16255 [Mesorhizobium sp.]
MALLLRWRLAKAAVSTISPQVGAKWGEMSGRTEGGAVPPASKRSRTDARSRKSLRRVRGTPAGD